MKISEIININEAKTSDLYHGTSAANANRIIKTNTLKAKAQIWNNVLQYMRIKPGQKNKTVSFSRSLGSAKAFSSRGGIKLGIAGVVFVVDQELLSRDFGKRLMPYNDLHSGHALLPGEGREVATEYEETVIGDVNNISKYIKKILVFVDPNKKDLVNKEKFPHLFKDPRVEIVSNAAVPIKTGKHLTAYDKQPTAREISNAPRLSI